MPKLLIATGNSGKFREIMEVLEDIPGFEFVSLEDLGMKNEVEENGMTYEDNSLLKARFFFEQTGLPTLAEDSGIEVEALRNELGVKTRRWGAGEYASDEVWLQFFLARMEREENRRAKFICVPTVIWGKAPEEFRQFRGETWGKILKEPQTEIPQGIPISSVFLPEGMDRVYSALAPHEKNMISHRGKALQKVKTFLQNGGGDVHF